MSKHRSLWLLIFCAFLASCAGVTVQNQKSDPEKDKGIRYYEPAAFILVYTDSKGGLNSELIWLPDTSQVRTLRPYAVAAKNNATFQFDHGVLTQAKSEIDTTAIPKAALAALKTTALARVSAAMNVLYDRGDEGLPAPQLFRIETDTDGVWSLSESKTTPDRIGVTLSQQPK